MHLFSLICAASCLAMEIRKVDLNLKRDHNAPSTLNFQHALQKLEVVKDKLFPTKNGFLQNQQHFNKEDISKDAIDDIFAAVRNISKNSIADLVSGIETQMQTYADAMQTCTDTEGYVDANPKKGEYDGLVTETSTADAQVTAFETANDTECADVEAKCTKRDTEGLALYNAMVGSTGCSYSTPPDSTIVYDDGFVFSGADQFATTIEGLHTAWDTAKTECETETNKCNTASNNLNEANTNATTSCAAQEAKKVAGQSAYDTCWNTASGAFTGYTYADTLTPVQSQIEALENLICMISPAIDTLMDSDDTTNAVPNSAVACELVTTEPTDAEAVFIQTGRKTHHTRKTHRQAQAAAGGMSQQQKFEKFLHSHNMTVGAMRPDTELVHPSVGMYVSDWQYQRASKHGVTRTTVIRDDPYEPVPSCRVCNFWEYYFDGDAQGPNGEACKDQTIFKASEQTCMQFHFQRWTAELEACCVWDKPSPPEVYTTTSTSTTEIGAPTTVANEGYYVCTCTVDGEDHYKKYYDFTVQEVQAPEKDDAWDSLGCEGAQDDSNDGGWQSFDEGTHPCLGLGTSIGIHTNMILEDCKTACDQAVGCMGFLWDEEMTRCILLRETTGAGDWCDDTPCPLQGPGIFYYKCGGGSEEATTQAPEPCVEPMGPFKSPARMEDDGWTIAVDNNALNAPEAVQDFCDWQRNGYQNTPVFYGWNTDGAVGYISYTFKGSGTAHIAYSNCWHYGWVQLYIDGVEVPGDPAYPSDDLEYDFQFQPGTTVMLRDNGDNSVILLRRFEVECDP